MCTSRGFGSLIFGCDCYDREAVMSFTMKISIPAKGSAGKEFGGRK